MSKSVISEGKTTQEAIEKGLKEIKLPRELCEIKILEENKKSFFDILAPKIVRVEIKEIEARKPEEVEIETTDEELNIAKKDVEEFLNELKHEYEDFMRVNYPQVNIRKTLNEIGFNFIGVNEDFNIDKYSMPKSKNSVNRIDYNYIAFNNFNSNTVQSKNELTQAAA